MLSVLRDNLLGVVIASLPGFIFICLGIYEIIIMRRKQKRETARAVGKVVCFDTRVSRTGKYRNVVRVHDSPVVEFSADGTKVRHTSDIEYRENTFEVDEIVHLFYDPSAPSRFHLEKGFGNILSMGGTLIAAGIGWVVITCALVILFPR
ncbi:MAG: hypothetical protein Q4G47_05510 [Lachnospiraceae bacterium]|nr:hypothetical protein [Lachnospiraceae bacterium]